MSNLKLKIIKVDIPVDFLLELATNGIEGMGKIPDYIVSWAKVCILNNKLGNDLIVKKKEKLKILESNLRKLIGKENVEFLNALSNAINRK